MGDSQNNFPHDTKIAYVISTEQTQNILPTVS